MAASPLGRRAQSQWLEDDHRIESWWATTIVNEYEIARGDLAKDGKPKGYSICATKSIKASPKDCYAAFASAEGLDAWFGPKHEVEMREGGHWRNGDGNRATIGKVNPAKNIRFIAEDEDLTLPAPVEDQVRAEWNEVHGDGHDRPAPDARRGGWLSARLGRGARATEGHRSKR